MTDDEWAQLPGPREMVRCGACQEHIWEPDTGDGCDMPNLTMIRPNLRDLAHRALEEREVLQFLMLAEGHHRDRLIADNAMFFHRLELWDDMVLGLIT
jgi:hypothetical protein